MTSSSPKHLSKFDSILWFWTKTGGTQFAAHYLRGAVIGRLEERWVQQGKPRLACRSFYLNQEKKSVLSTKPWSFWAEVLLDSPDHVQAPSCWQNQLTMALNWTYRAFFRELAHARGAASELCRILRYILRVCVPSHQNGSTDAWMWGKRMWLFVERGNTIYNGKETSHTLTKLQQRPCFCFYESGQKYDPHLWLLPLQCHVRVSKCCGEEKCSLDRWGCGPYRAILGAKEHSALHIRPFMWPSLAASCSDICMHNLQRQVSALMRCKELIIWREKNAFWNIQCKIEHLITILQNLEGDW